MASNADVVTSRNCGADQALAGIGDAGRSRIGDDGDVSTARQDVEYVPDQAELGVLVAHGESGGANPGVLEETTGAAGVFAAHERSVGNGRDRSW